MESEVLIQMEEPLLHATVDVAFRNGLTVQEFINYLLRKAVGDTYKTFADMPVADWVKDLSATSTETTEKMNPKGWKAEFYESKI